MKKIEQMREWWLSLNLMRKKKQLVPIVGGEIRDYFNSLIILSVGIFNVINQIIENKNIIERLQYTAPFFVVSFLILNYKTSKITKSIMFLVIGIFYHIAIDDPSALGAVMFFVLSFMQFENNKYGIFILMSSLIIITVKSSFVNDTPSQIVSTVGAFIFLYGNFYKIVNEYKSKIADLRRQLKEKYKKKPVTRNIDIINISEEEKAIIKLYCYGNTYEEISKILGLNVVPKTVRRKISAIMKDYNIKNDAHFGHWVFQEA